MHNYKFSRAFSNPKGMPREHSHPRPMDTAVAGTQQPCWDGQIRVENIQVILHPDVEDSRSG